MFQLIKDRLEIPLAQLTCGKKDLPCYEVAQEILWEAADPRLPMQRTMIARLGALFDALFESHGDDLLVGAKNLSSGHIPKEARPCERWAFGSAASISKVNNVASPSGPGGMGTTPRTSSKDLLRRISQMVQAAGKYYEDIVRHDNSLSEQGKLDFITQWLDREFAANNIPKRAVKTTLDELGEPTFHCLDAMDGWQPEDLAHVQVEDRYVSVQLPATLLDPYIVKLRPEDRPKTHAERQALMKGLAQATVYSQQENIREDLRELRERNAVEEFDARTSLLSGTLTEPKGRVTGKAQKAEASDGLKSVRVVEDDGAFAVKEAQQQKMKQKLAKAFPDL